MRQRGWISVDRDGKTTLPLTMPRRVFKSSAKDPAHHSIGITIQGLSPQLVRCGGKGPTACAPGGARHPYRGSAIERWAMAPHN